MSPFSPHILQPTPSRPGRSLVTLGAVLSVLGLLALPARATTDDPQTPDISVISPQYQTPAFDEIVPPASGVIDGALPAAMAATATEQADSLPLPDPPPQPVATLPTTSKDSINSAPLDTSQALDLPVGVVAPVTPTSALGDHAAPVPSDPAPDVPPTVAPVDDTPATAGAAMPEAVPAAEAVQAVAQTVVSDVAAPAAAIASQAAPTNLNVVVRVNSPGDDGPVTQTNAPAGGPAATPPQGPPDPAATGVSVVPAAAGALPTTWIWNWNWTATDCASGASSPAQSSVIGGTWTWNWNWGCAPASPPRLRIAVPTVAAPAHAGHVQWAGHVPTAAPAARATMTARNPVPSPADGPHEGVDGSHGSGATVRNPFFRVLHGRGSAAQHANAAAKRAPTASRQTLGGSPRDTMPPIGVIAPAAAAIASAGPSAGGGGLAAATLLAILAFFAPQLLLPLWTASARRPGNASSRHERPG